MKRFIYTYELVLRVEIAANGPIEAEEQLAEHHTYDEATLVDTRPNVQQVEDRV